MAYQVFARKYRPQAFDEVLGQEAIVRTLKNAIELDRLHHAYLFCGARGVGKTSLARIFAKSLNCEKGPTVAPCQQCTSCQNITKGISLDVFEIDAASNTGIDNVRELRDQARYLPTEGKYKIYIIDEVHMLSEAAFNGLLKTMEEPPPHLIFIMATTEPHEIPATILSRCQRFDCTRFKTGDLENHLKNILAQENVTLPAESLLLIAQSADGSVRDSLSLLDQVVSYCGAGADVNQVAHLLGYAERTLVHDMLSAVIQGDLNRGLNVLKTLHEKGGDLKIFGESLLHFLRDTMIFGEGGATHLEVSPVELEKITALSKQSANNHLLILFQILSRTLDDLSRSEFPQLIFEVGLVKLIHAKDCLSIPQLIDQLESSKTTVSPPARATSRFQPPPSASPNAKASYVPYSAKPAAVQPTVKAEAPMGDNNWHAFVAKVKSEKPQMGSLIDEAHALNFDSKKVVLAFVAGSIHADMLKDRKNILENFLKIWFGETPALEIKILNSGESAPATALEVRQQQASAKQAELTSEALSHPTIQKTQEILGATLIEVREVK